MKVREFVAEPRAAQDERIDVGVLFVGGGPAGLAGAIRMGQLLAADPATAERLGEVPVAVLDKGKVVGAHLLSGAVVNPSALRDLLPDTPIEQLPSYGPVKHESVYFMRPGYGVRIPTPPPFHNKGNWIFSLAQLGRHLAGLAEEFGAMVLPETAAHTLLVSGGAVRGVVTGAKGLGRDGEPTGSYEPGAEIHAQATVLSEGTQGHLTAALTEAFGLRSQNPQVWSLGVKELWRVKRPLDRVIHTLGWPLRAQAKYGESGGSFIYPMGEDQIALGLVVGLDYRDASLSVHDLLQEFKLHPLIRPLLEGGERTGWGAKTIPEGGFYALPSRLSVPGAVITGDAAGFVNVPKLKGIHYAMRSGMLAAEAIYEQLKAGADPAAAGALGRLRRPGAVEPHLVRPAPRPQHAPGAQPRPGRRRRIGRRDGRHPRRPPRRALRHTPRRRGGDDDRAAQLPRARRRAHLRQALERLSLRQPQPRRPAQPHPRAHPRPARGRPDVGGDVPGRRLRAAR